MKTAVIRLFRGSGMRFKNILREMIYFSKKFMWYMRIVPPPFRIQIDITDCCNFKCPTCLKWSDADLSRELKAAEWGTIFEKISYISLLHEVTISGGELFAREDIFEILLSAKQKGFYTVVISNGWFVNREALEKLTQIGVDRLIVSLNSLKEGIHDESRGGTMGSYRQIMNLIALWKEQSGEIDLCLETVVMEPNCGELSALAEFAQKNDLNGIFFQVLAPEQAHYSFAGKLKMPDSRPLWYEDDPLWVKSSDILRREVGNLLRLKKKGYTILNTGTQLRKFLLYYESPKDVHQYPCLGTLSTMYIDPFGEVRLCYGFPPVGNVLNDDPVQIWKSPKARSVRFESRQCDKLCRILNNNL